jgi:hypothetical protein
LLSFSENFALPFSENICGEAWVTMLDAGFRIIDEEIRTARWSAAMGTGAVIRARVFYLA